MIFLILSALGCGILAGLGVGSGGIFVVLMSLFMGYEQLYAQSLNLIFFVASSSAAVAVNLFKGRIAWRVVIPVVIFGCIGSLGGALIAHQIGSRVLTKLFGIVLVACGAVSLLKKEK